MMFFTLRWWLGEVEGYVRLAIPQAIISALSSDQESFVDLRIPQFESRRMGAFDYFRTILWGAVGRVTLSVAELKQLDRGDIILFDESYPTLSGNHVRGRLRLRVGEGDAGAIEGTIAGEGAPQPSGTLKVNLERVILS